MKKKEKKASMSFLTALGLSANNLRTKKGRTIMTAFAGSIGIIGIALILALSSGINDYIQRLEEDTMAEYPITISSSTIDLTSLMASMSPGGDMGASGDALPDEKAEISVVSIITNMLSHLSSNDLTSLKEYIDSGESGLENYTKSVEYQYNVTPLIYIEQGDEVYEVNPDTALTGSSSIFSFMSSSTSTFYCMPEEQDLYIDQYNLMAGHWPENYNECVLVLTSNGSISDYMLYILGLKDYSEFEDMINIYNAGEDVVSADRFETYSYDDVLGITFKVINTADLYTYDEDYGVWVDKSDNASYVKNLVENGEDLTIVGVVQPDDTAIATSLSAGINYSKSLIYHMSELAATSDVVQAQMNDPETNIFTGEEFGEDSDALDLASLLNIDEDTLADAYDFSDIFSDIEFDTPDMEMDTSDMEMDTASMDFDMSDMDLSGLDFSDLDMDFSDMDLSGLDLTSLDFSGMDMSTLDFSDMDLSSLDLSGLDLSSVDLSGVDMSALDFSNLDLSSMELDMSTIDTGSFDFSSLLDFSDLDLDLPDLDMSGLDGEFTVDTATMDLLAKSIVNGYILKVNTTGVAADFSDYLASDAAKEILINTLSESGALSLTVDEEGLKAAMQAAIDDFEESDDEQLVDAIYEAVSSYLSENVTITITDTSALADALVAGYEASVSADFTEYLQSDTVSAMISGTMTSMMMAQMQAVMGSALSSYMESYTQALTTAIQSQVEAAMQQAMAQMAQSIAAQIAQQLGDQIGTQMNVAMEGVMQQMVAVMTEQVGTQLGTQLGEQISTQMSAAMETAMAAFTEQMTEQISTQVSAAVGNLMADTMTAMMTQVSDTATTQVSAVMEKAMTEMATAMSEQMSASMQEMMSTAMESMVEQMTDALTDAFSMDSEAMQDAFSFDMDSADLTDLLTSMTTGTGTSYNSNLNSLGYLDLDSPYEIDIYPKDFDNKAYVVDILDAYNDDMEQSGEDDKVISYTDIVATMMSSVTKIVNVVSYVLIAFVAVSLIVSCIMISIITQISTMERIKEIGILRAMGASKGNISQVFNAETFIIGISSGLIGVIITEILIIPTNMIIHKVAESNSVNAVLPISNAAILVLISIVITVLSGLVPALRAAKQDPVTALRTE